MIRTLSFAVFAALCVSQVHAQQQQQQQSQQSQQQDSSVPLGDECFAMKAYSDGLAEVAMSQLAAERATERGVKEFAEKMVKEHTACNQKLAETAQKKGIPLPKAPDAIHAYALNKMAKMSGSDFDKIYLKAQIGAHKDAIHLFSHESYKGEDSELKAFAHKTLPDLWMHTKHAFELAGEKGEYEKMEKVHEHMKKVMSEK